MHVLITGADGFVGRALASRLLAAPSFGSRPIERLTLLDVRFSAPPSASVERHLSGSIANAELVRLAFEEPVDVVFHLASIPGGTAEQHYELSRDVNLRGTEHLLEQGKAQVERGGAAPVFVFASSIAVFGSPLPPQVDDVTPLTPQMTYGAQKVVGEVLVSDFSRRRWVDGRSLRLPGVVARPPAETGQMSAFMSNIFRELAAGRPFTCPTSPQATTWASSIHNVVDNLLHGAALPAAALAEQRVFTLPTLRFSFGDLVEAIAEVHGPAVRGLVTWAPDPRIERLFGSFPPLITAAAEAAGFRSDGDLVTLVDRALVPV